MNKSKKAAAESRSENNLVKFEWLIWTIFAFNNWVLDFGRPIAMLVFPLEWFPLSLPSVGDYFHMAYNVLTPFCLYRLMSKTSKQSNLLLVNVCLIFFIMGASIHLVGDSINHRLSLIGYEFHLSLEDNPIMKELRPKDLVESFKLLYFYDEVLGHYMWYIPFFLCLIVYFDNCFSNGKTATPQCSSCVFRSSLKFLLISLSALYYWYLVTEGQITPLFVATLSIMQLLTIFRCVFKQMKLDENGKFLLVTFQLTFFLVAIWCYHWWDDVQLRKKYTSVIYVPEPWSVYSLYFKGYLNLFAK